MPNSKGPSQKNSARNSKENTDNQIEGDKEEQSDSSIQRVHQDLDEVNEHLNKKFAPESKFSFQDYGGQTG